MMTMPSANQMYPDDSLPEEIQQKIKDFQPEVQVKYAIMAALVLGGQAVLVLIVAVLLMVSPSHTPSLPAASGAGAAPGVPGVYDYTVPAAADTYIDRKMPLKNYGSGKTLRLTGGTASTCNTLLRFSLPSLKDYTVKSVDLLLTPTRDWGASRPAVKILTCADTWNEQTVTFNAKVEEGALLGYLAEGYEFSDGQVRIPLDPNAFSDGGCIAIWVGTPTAGADVKMASREAGHGPRLFLRLKGQKPPPACPAVNPVPDEKIPAGPVPPVADPDSGSSVTATTPATPPVPGQWKRIFYESFEDPDVGVDQGESKPSGWLAFGHPAYQHLVNEKSGRFVTPYGAQGLSCYTPETGDAKRSFSMTSQDVLAEKLAENTRYLLMFNVAAVSATPAAYYRVELLAIDDAAFPGKLPRFSFDDAKNGVTVLAETIGVNDGSKDMSASYHLLFDPIASHKNLLGKRLAIRLGMDNEYSSKGGGYRDQPVFDNISLFVDTTRSGK